MVDPAMLLASARTALATLPRILECLLGDLDAATWRGRPALAEWSPVEIVCHLRDEEAEDFGARVRVVVEGGDRFAAIDPERWAVERRYRDADPSTARTTFGKGRAAGLAFLPGVPPGALRHGVTHPR